MNTVSRFCLAGRRVVWTAKHMPKGMGLSYETGIGYLMEGATIGPNAGWDVVDVRADDGTELSVYAFSLEMSKAPKTKPNPETFPQYLNRVGTDYQTSARATNPDEDSPTAEDYFRAADTIEDLSKAIARMIDAFGLDDRSMFTVEQRKALRAAERLMTGYRPMGKRLI